ncbi:unnamed protein product, partial [marine sediment metagenome]
MHRGLLSRAITGKTQADGAQTISLVGYEEMNRHQFQVETDGTSEAGALIVSIRSPGAGGYYAFEEAFDLTIG